MREKTRENLGIAAAVGIREGRARRSYAARVIKPPLMARHRRFDIAQRSGPRQLAMQQRQQLALGRETARQFAGPVILHKPIELRPRNEFQNVAKDSIGAQDSIGIRHGADPFHIQLSRKPLDTMRINAVRLAQQNRTGQPWA
jgi:hypothetical protein